MGDLPMHSGNLIPSPRSQERKQVFWLRAARRLALRRNVAAWLDGFLSASLAITVVTAAALLAFRSMGRDLRPIWFSYAGLLGTAAVVCGGLVATRRPFTLFQALVRLDEVEKLHNRLTAAFCGIGHWPPTRPDARDAVRWNWKRLGVPLLLSGMILGIVSLVELPRSTTITRPSDEPMAWTQIESWLNTLEKAKLPDPAALERVEQQLDELRHQPEKDWYSQNSLEAGDALQQQTAQSLRELKDNLQKSSELLESAKGAGAMPASELQNLSVSLSDMGGHLLSGNLPLNKELGNQMRNFDPSTLKSMSPEQLQALRQRLSDGAKVCSQCLGPNVCDGDMSQCSRPSGHGGGGGPAPLGLDENAENLHTQRVEGASNDDPSRAIPAEVMAMAKGKHEVDKNKIQSGPVDGGAISSAGQGGDAVWRDSLTPAEREVLQKYFK